MYHGVVPFDKGNILGHEFVGVVEEIGEDISTIQPGDRVVGTSSIACGVCEYCQMGQFSQCDNANPVNPGQGAAFFGSPPSSGSFPGTQAEFVRVPYADTVLYKLPEQITDIQALILSDIFPTGYHGAIIAEVKPGESVAVFGAGPVGQMAALSAKILGAEKIYIVDNNKNRLNMAAEHIGAEIINFNENDPVEEIKRRTNGRGVDKTIDAVGLEAETDFKEKISEALTSQVGSGKALQWAIESVRKVGVVSVIGFYAGPLNNFNIGRIMGNNITLRGGNCPHRAYLDVLVKHILEDGYDPSFVITNQESFDNVEKAYECFDKNSEECIKIAIKV
jgi:threonine dehydrogenase-like Zn-dependent dehydrogenase